MFTEEGGEPPHRMALQELMWVLTRGSDLCLSPLWGSREDRGQAVTTQGPEWPHQLPAVELATRVSIWWEGFTAGELIVLRPNTSMHFPEHFVEENLLS